MKQLIKIGDTVDVYVTVGEKPYEHEIRTVIGINSEEDIALLDDNSSVGLFYCTKINKKPSELNILVGCEESQAICIEFRKLGFNAYSCDLLESSGGHPETKASSKTP